MIVSTPTGSTAYSLSAGGPVIDPRVKGICITPVCAHSFASRAMVFPSESVIEVKNTCEREPNLFLTIDGRVNIRLDHGNIVRVMSSEKMTKLIRVKDKKKYSELFKKLYS
jgi:NAD+ kinase